MTVEEAAHEARVRAERLYAEGEFYCSEAVFTVANEHLGFPVPAECVRVASGFAVGMGWMGCSCGALTGGVMALGLKYGRSSPRGEMPRMFEAVRRLYEAFIARRGSACCRVLTEGLELGTPAHKRQCVEITGEVAADVIRLLEDGPAE